MGIPFRLQKIGHVVLYVADLARATRFYTEVLGLKVSDTYPDSMMPGGMVFLRFSTDHHGIALVGAAGPKPARVGLHHMAFEVATLDEVFRARDYLQMQGATIVYQGRRRAGCQIAVEFLDPDGHHLEVYWGLDQIGSDGRARSAEEWRQTMTLEDAVRVAPPGQDTTLHDPALAARVVAR